MTDSIAVVNLSRRLSQEDAMTMVDACNRRLAEDVCPAWGVSYRPANLYDSISKLPPLTTDPVFILDTPGRKGVYGEHFRALTPAGRIYCDPLIDEGKAVPLRDQDNPQRLSIAACLDHELSELTVNPDVSRYAIDAQGDEWDLEVDDMVQRNQVDKVVEMPWGTVTVALSDFVLPNFFRPGSPGPWNFSKASPLPGPFSLAPGGYAMKNGDPVYARRTDGTGIYPEGWWLAHRLGGRAAKIMLGLQRQRLLFR